MSKPVKNMTVAIIGTGRIELQLVKSMQVSVQKLLATMHIQMIL